MLNLIKSDLKRIVKDKLFTIVLIIAGAFALLTPLMYVGLFKLLDGAEDLLGMVVNGKALYFDCFYPSGNAGLIIPVLIAIILCKDFSYGTVRNKIISGKTRSQIFFSMFIASALVICAIMIAYALLTLGFSLIFVEYQPTPFTVDDLWYILFSTLLEIIVYVCISALVCFICVFAKNIGLCIVLYVGVMMLFSIIGSVVEVAFMFATPNTANYKFLEFCNNINVFYPTIIGQGTSYPPSKLLYVLVPPIFGTGILLFLGNLIFNKKDLK